MKLYIVEKPSVANDTWDFLKDWNTGHLGSITEYLKMTRERENDKETTTQERQSSERVQDNDEPEYDL